jgi:hypothetical protein
MRGCRRLRTRQEGCARHRASAFSSPSAASSRLTAIASKYPPAENISAQPQKENKFIPYAKSWHSSATNLLFLMFEVCPPQTDGLVGEPKCRKRPTTAPRKPTRTPQRRTARRPSTMRRVITKPRIATRRPRTNIRHRRISIRPKRIAVVASTVRVRNNRHAPWGGAAVLGCRYAHAPGDT